MPPLRPLTAVLVAATLLAACGANPTHTSPVSVSITACGLNWTATAAGRQHITLHNTDSRGGEAQLIDPQTGAVFADVEPFGPGTTTSVDVDLKAGKYTWRCLMEDEAAVNGPTVTLTGSATGTTPGVRPVSQADLIGATKTYEGYVSGQLPTLATEVDRLSTDIAHGDLAAARRDWLPAHLEYERLGAAYDAFGDLDGDINGLPSGLAKGVHDPQWTGFHRIEYGLWHSERAATLAPVARHLATSVAKLRHQFATAQIDPLQLSIRAHEISENALQFELTGRTDFGSHSALDTVLANLDGTEEVLAIIDSLIAPRYAQLPQAKAQLQQTQTDIEQHASHERIDADVSQLCELLAPIAAILEPRKTS